MATGKSRQSPLKSVRSYKATRSQPMQTRESSVKTEQELLNMEEKDKDKKNFITTQNSYGKPHCSKSF